MEPIKARNWLMFDLVIGVLDEVLSTEPEVAALDGEVQLFLQNPEGFIIGLSLAGREQVVHVGDHDALEGVLNVEKEES